MTQAGVGPLIRDWRRRRRLSQLDLALEAGVSARHLSFLETGRSRPSPQMVLHLADQLEVPLRERNRMLLAAGYAPVYGERPLDAPELEPVRAALDLVLAGHSPIRRSSSTARGTSSRRTPAWRCSPTASRPSCSARPPTRCAWRCTPTAWRRGSPTSASGT